MLSSQKAPWKTFFPVFLAVHPPGEVERSFWKARFRNATSPFPSSPLGVVDEELAQAWTGGFTSPKFHS